jgi:hypothetical protein
MILVVRCATSDKKEETILAADVVDCFWIFLHKKDVWLQ